MQTFINHFVLYAIGVYNMLKTKELLECENTGAVFLFLRENKDFAYTQKELAEKLEIHQSNIARQLKYLISIKWVNSKKAHQIVGNPFHYYSFMDE